MIFSDFWGLGFRVLAFFFDFGVFGGLGIFWDF